MVCGGPLEVLQEKHGVGLELHLFLEQSSGVEGVWQDNVRAELQSVERSSPKQTLNPTFLGTG